MRWKIVPACAPSPACFMETDMVRGKLRTESMTNVPAVVSTTACLLVICAAVSGALNGAGPLAARAPLGARRQAAPGGAHIQNYTAVAATSAAGPLSEGPLSCNANLQVSQVERLTADRSGPWMGRPRAQECAPAHGDRAPKEEFPWLAVFSQRRARSRSCLRTSLWRAQWRSRAVPRIRRPHRLTDRRLTRSRRLHLHPRPLTAPRRTRRENPRPQASRSTRRQPRPGRRRPPRPRRRPRQRRLRRRQRTRHRRPPEQ